MTSIGIVGTGISGLTLALTLQQAGIDTTVYAQRTPDEMRRTRLPNAVARFAPTIARERALGVEHWGDKGSVEAFHISILDSPIAFIGRMRDPGSCVDFRVYLPQLLEDYADRGGDVAVGPRSPDDVVAECAHHDLTVIASGRDSVDAFFPRDATRSAHSGPLRILCASLWHGIAPPLDPPGVSFSIAPGVGEILTFPFFSRHGVVTGITVEALAGGPLEPIPHASYDDDPAAFEALMVDLIRRYAPSAHERIDRSEFALTGTLDILQGAITPTVRRPYCEIGPGRFVIALGDCYVVNDPIGGQGANVGSTTAAVLAEAICQDVPYDELFCRRVEREMWSVVEPATNFNNSFLLPPEPQADTIFVAASKHQSVANAFCDNFGNPDAMWRSLATPDGAAAFLTSAGVAAVSSEPASADDAAQNRRDGYGS